MLSRKDIAFLRGFRSTGNPVISMYLNTDGSQFSKKAVETHLKEMTRSSRQRLSGNTDKLYRKQVIREIERAEDYIINQYKEFNQRGIALFVSSEQQLWHEVELPRPPRNRFIVDDVPFLRPLQFQELEYHRICTVLVDNHAARIFQIYQGAILEYKLVADDVPDRMRWGGWAGYDEKRSTRKFKHKINEHFQNVAEVLFDLYKRDQYEWLIVGCKPEAQKEFEAALHSYLQERIAARFDEGTELSDHEVLERSMKVERRKVYQEHCQTVERLLQTVKADGGAIAGLEDVLRHLNAGAVEELVVSRDHRAQGVNCSECHFLGILEQVCSICGSETTESPDIITDAIDRAMDTHSTIHQVFEGIGLENAGHIGAFIRFRV